jgi:uncharacterized protein (TIGR00661 family)
MNDLYSGGKMAKIAWSVASEGAGHAARNLTLIRTMVKRGHSVDIYTGEDTYRPLNEYLSINHALKSKVRLFRIPGFLFQYDSQGRIKFGRVIRHNIKPFFEMSRNFRALVRKIKKEKYDLVVVDFEPYFSRAARIAALSVSSRNRVKQIQASSAQAAISYTKLDVPEGMSKSKYAIFRRFVRSFEPKPDICLVETPFKPISMPHNTLFVGPVIRPEVRNAKLMDKGYIHVYAKPIIEQLMIPIIAKVAGNINKRFIIYCNDPDSVRKKYNLKHLGQRIQLKKVTLANSYINDFARCSGVISTGGTELAADAIWLEKPLLAIMQTYQYEQYVSGHYTKKNGLGKAVLSIDLTEQDIIDFIKQIPRFKKNIKKYKATLPCGSDTIPDILESYLPHKRRENKLEK